MKLDISTVSRTMYLSLDSVDDADKIDIDKSIINNKQKIRIFIPTTNIFDMNKPTKDIIFFKEYYNGYQILILNTKTNILHTGTIINASATELQIELDHKELNDKFTFIIHNIIKWATSPKS